MGLPYRALTLWRGAKGHGSDSGLGEAILVAYDLWSTRKVHRATIWAGAFLIFVQQIRIPIGRTATWHAFATWIQTLAR